MSSTQPRTPHSGRRDGAAKARSPRWRTVLAMLAVNAGAVLLALFFATEWFIARKAKVTLRYRPHPAYRQELVPNQVYVRDGFRYRIGAHGLRGEAPAGPAPPGRTRVAVMGGSSVFDFRVGTSWPERVASRLRAQGLRVEVMNAGVPGFSTREIIPFFEEKISAFEPDVVVLYAGWNDVKYMRASRKTLQLEAYPPPPAVDPYAWLTAPRPVRNLRALPKLFEKVRARAGFVAENRAPSRDRSSGEKPGAPTVQTSTTPERDLPPWDASAGVRYWADNLRRWVEQVRDHGAAPIFVIEATLHAPGLPEAEHGRIAYEFVDLDPAGLHAVTEAMTRALLACARALDVPVIDPRPDVRGRPSLFHDHVHLSEAGSEALAAAVAPELARLLRSGRLDTVEEASATAPD